jgi:hypothetical protein
VSFASPPNLRSAFTELQGRAHPRMNLAQELAARLGGCRRVALVGNGGIALELVGALLGLQQPGGAAAARAQAGAARVGADVRMVALEGACLFCDGGGNGRVGAAVARKRVCAGLGVKPACASRW